MTKHDFDEKWDEKWAELNCKIYKAFSMGKLQLSPDISIEELEKNLNLSIKLEEYEASALFRDEINKRKYERI